MLQKENRLAKKRDFNLLLKRGIWVKSRDLALKVLSLAENKNYFPKNEDFNKFEKQLKIAFSVGLKISKNATVRNRLKRQLREVVRLLIQSNQVNNGFYVLVVPDPNYKDKNYAEISKEIKLLFDKAKLLK